jgi:hypothetical protein
LLARFSAIETVNTNLQTGKADASRVTVLEARTSQPGILSPNPGFDDYPNPTGPPPAWPDVFGVVSPSRYSRITDGAGGNALRVDCLAGETVVALAYSNSNTILPNGWYVTEVDAYLNGGSNVACGAWCDTVNDPPTVSYGQAAMINFSTTPDIDGQTGDIFGRRRRWSVLWQAPSTAAVNRGRIYLGNYPGVFGGTTAQNRSHFFYEAFIRKATPSEIETRQARGVYPTLGARVLAAESATATLEGRLEARALLQTTAGNQVAGMQLLAVSGPDVAYSTIDFWASAVRISNGGLSPIAPFVVRDNVVRIQELLVDRVAVGVSIVVGSRRLALAVQPFPVLCTDGVPIAYGYNIGLAPTIVFLRDGAISTPGSAESYDFYPEASDGTGFIPRLKIKTAAAPATVVSGPGGHSSDGTAQFYYALTGGRANTTINVRSTGVIQYQWVNNRFDNPHIPEYEEPGYESDRYTEGYMVLQTHIYNGGWRNGPQIEVYPPPLNSGVTGLRTSAYDTGDVPITVNPSDSYVGLSLAYESHAGSYVTDLRLTYQTAGASGVRSATPNGELTTAMIYPKNGA